jgi:hypothetical protein
VFSIAFSAITPASVVTLKTGNNKKKVKNKDDNSK